LGTRRLGTHFRSSLKNINKNTSHLKKKWCSSARRFHPPKNRSVRDVVRILFVGVLSERRGLLELLEATKMLCNNGEKVELWLAGDGPLSPLAHSYAQKYVS